jgi:hypothetical protein
MREPNDPSAPMPAVPAEGDPEGAPASQGSLGVGDFNQMMWRLRLKRWAPLALASLISLVIGIALGASIWGGSSASASAATGPCPEAEVVEAGSAPTAEEPAQHERTPRARRSGDHEVGASSSATSGGHF